MPMYEFLCSECEHEFTDIQTVENRNVACSLPCPKCGKEGGVKKQLSGFKIANPISMNSGKMMDSNLRNRFDSMAQSDPNFNWTLGRD